MNAIIREHLRATFSGVPGVRDQLLELLTDDDLGYRVGGANASLGALCREIGEIERAYVDSFRSFRLDFGFRNPDPELERSVAALVSRYVGARSRA